MLLLLGLLAGCGVDDPPPIDPATDAAVPDGAAGMSRATLTGVVHAIRGEELGVVPGAIVEVLGRRAVANELGAFSLDDLPAGEPLVVRIAGPALDPSSEPIVYGSRDLAVTLEEGTITTIAPRLLTGCARTLEGALGGTLDLAGCGARAGSLTLEPNGVVDASGAIERGPILVQAVLADPDAAIAWSAVPPSDDTLAGLVEIRLVDPRTGAPMQIASGATARVEIPVRPGVLAGAAIWDRDAVRWQALEAAPVPTATGMAALEVSHFSTYVMRLPPPDDACVRVEPLVCRSGGTCAHAGVWIDVLDLETGDHSEHVARGEICVPVRRGAYLRIEARYVVSVFATVYRAVRTVRVPNTNAACERTGCFDAGEMRLAEVPTGCVTGTFLGRSGDPVFGTVRVVAGGEHVASTVVPRDCDGGFCVPVPLGLGEVTFESSHGTLTFTPSATAVLGTCEPPAPMLAQCSVASGCEDVSGTLACVGSCIVPAVRASAALDSSCSADRPYRVELDASGSTGAIGRYELFVIDEDGHLEGSAGGLAPTASFCVPSGAYDVVLHAFARGRFVTARTSFEAGDARPELDLTIEGSGRVTSEPAGIDCETSCSARFTRGSAVSLRASAGSGATIAWNGDCVPVDGPGSNAASVAMDGARRCTVRFTPASPTFYVSLPFVPTLSPSSIATIAPEAWDPERRAVVPAREVYPDLVRCDWGITHDFVPRGTITTTDCEPLLLGPASADPDVVLELGSYSIHLAAHRASGETSESAHVGFTVTPTGR